MTVPTIRERIYEVVATQTCTVSTPDGLLICVAEPGSPVSFVAPGNGVEVSDDAATVTPAF